MTVTMHWWMLPIMLALMGVILIFLTRSDGGYFPQPSWHLFAGATLILAAICIVIGAGAAILVG